MKDTHYSLQFAVFEYMRSLTTLVIAAFSRVYTSIFEAFQFRNETSKLASFPRILRLRRIWESSASRY